MNTNIIDRPAPTTTKASKLNPMDRVTAMTGIEMMADWYVAKVEKSNNQRLPLEITFIASNGAAVTQQVGYTKTFFVVSK